MPVISLPVKRGQNVYHTGVPFISKKTIEEIRARLDPVGIVGEYVRLERRGGNFWGLCPFHNEKTPSFAVNPDRKSYYCFGCHEGGSILDFVMNMEKLSFPETLAALAKKTGVRVEYEEGGGESPRDEGLSQFRDDLIELYRRVAGSFNHILTETPEGGPAREYLMSRGLSREVFARRNLGFAPADRYWLHKFLSGKGYSRDFLAKSGLFSENYPEAAFFSARLIFPINDRQGRVVAFGGRILEGDGPKYLNSRESAIFRKRETLFGLDTALPEIRRSKEVYICEGYMDVIAMQEAGVINSAAPLGTAFTAEHARFLRRWADRVNLLFDADAAGEAAAEKAVLVCREAGINCAVTDIRLPGLMSFKDPADILRDAGAEILSKSVKSVILDSEYLITKSKSRFLHRPNDPQGVAKAVAFLAPFYRVIETEAEKEAFARKAADAFGIEPRAVQHDLKFGREKGAVLRRAGEADRSSRVIAMNEELYLLAAVAVNIETHPELFEALRAELPGEEFEDRDAKELYLALEECLRSDELFLDALLARLSDEALRDFIAAKSTAREFSDRADRIVEGAIRGIRVKHLERRGRKLDTELRLAVNSGRGADDLLLEKQFVIDELQKLQGVKNGSN